MTAASPSCIGSTGYREKAARSPASLAPARHLLADFVRFAGLRRIAAAFTLIVIGTALDGLGILLLVELLQWFLTPGRGEATGELALAMRQSLAGLDPLVQVAVGFAAVAGLLAARCLVLVARDTTVARLQHGFVETIRLRLFERVASASWTSIIKADQAQLVQLLGSEIVQMAAAVHNALQASVAAIMLLGLATFAIVLAPGLGLFTVAFIVALSASANILMHRSVAAGRRLLRHDLSMAGTSVSFLHALKLAKAQGVQEPFQRRYAVASGAALRQRIAFARFASLSSNIIALATLLLVAAVALAGTFAFGVPAPTLIAFALTLSRMTSPALAVQRGVQHVAHNVPRFELLRSLDDELEAAPPAEFPADGTRGALVRGCSIRLEEVSFRRTPACEEGLSNLCLTIGAGELVGIAGASGSGKTTLLDLLAGLIEPNSGVLSINGEILSDCVLANYRASLSYLGLEPLLFVGTLRDNLTWAAPDATDEEIWHALDLVCASDLVRRNGGNLDTVIIEGPNRFSAGERQRLALASSILRRPTLMLLDEATASLDVGSESTVIAAVRRLRPSPTMLLISHRAESLALCDRLVTLDAGRIVVDEVRGMPSPSPSQFNLRRVL